MTFENRQDAAMQLIPHLNKYAKEDVVVLAIPRGGIPIGYYIAKAYGWPLDIMLTKKIGHPANPEMAIGSVSLEGEVIDNDYATDSHYLKKEINRIRKILKERYALYMSHRKPLLLEGKTVIIADDGIATGNTMIASIDVARHQKPGKLIVAVPVAPPNTVSQLKRITDDVICLFTPDYFRAIGQFYRDFEQVSDEEVLQFLRASENNNAVQYS